MFLLIERSMGELLTYTLGVLQTPRGVYGILTARGAGTTALYITNLFTI
jgi:hypothetical protein